MLRHTVVSSDVESVIYIIEELQNIITSIFGIFGKTRTNWEIDFLPVATS